MRSKLLVTALFVILAGGPARAQWQPGYGSGAFYGGTPYCAVEFGGRLVVGGNFDGADCTWSPAVIATDFTRYYALAGRLPGPGTVHASVNALAVYEGQLVAAGEFEGSIYRGYVNVARHDGTQWVSLGASDGQGGLYGGPVYDLVVFEGDLVAVGEFYSSETGTVLGGIARWDGTAWQPMGTRPAGARALAVHEGALYCGLSRWDGGAWESLGTIGPGGSLVTALDVVDEGLAIGGTFRTIDGATYDGTALVDATGLHPFGGGAWTDALPGSGLTEPEYPGVGGFASFGGETYMLAPRFQIYPYRYCMVSRMDTSGGGYRWVGLDEVRTGYVFSLRGGDLVVVGDRMVALMGTPWDRFDVEGAIMRSALVLRDGSWEGLVGGRGLVATPRAVAAGAGGAWIALGEEGLALQTGGTVRRVDPSSNYFDVASAPTGVVAVGGAPYGGDIGGTYPFISRISSESSIRFEELGSLFFEVEHAWAVESWQDGYLVAVETYGGWRGQAGIGFVDDEILRNRTFMVGVPVTAPVEAMVVHQGRPWYASDGQLFRIDGTPPLGMTGVLVATFNGPVEALASDGSWLLVGGDFDSMNAVPLRNLAAFDGAQWSQPFDVDGPVNALAVDRFGVVFAAGDFRHFEGELTSRLAVFRDGAIGTFPAGPDGPVTDLALTDQGLVVIGDFDSAGGLCANHVAEWWGSGESVGTGDPTPSRITAMRLLAPSPNPFNPRVTLAFELPRAAHVELSVYDLSGHHVRTVAAGERGPGRHEFVWAGVDGDGRRVASGVYFAVLEADGRRETAKMALVR